MSHRNDHTFFSLNERYKKPVFSTRKPHPTSKPCYRKGVFIIYSWEGERAEMFEVLPWGGGGHYSVKIIRGVSSCAPVLV